MYPTATYELGKISSEISHGSLAILVYEILEYGHVEKMKPEQWVKP